MELKTRRWVSRGIRAGLVLVTVLFVGSWISSKISRKARRFGDVHVQATPPTAAMLGAGDLQIFSRDSSVDLILRADKVMAGLSPKTVAKVRDEIAKSTEKDSSGLGGFIAQTVKQTVSGAIGTHVVYPVATIREMRYEKGEIVLVRDDGDVTRLFGNTKVNDEPLSNRFQEEDARRFIEAVQARRRELAGLGSKTVPTPR